MHSSAALTLRSDRHPRPCGLYSCDAAGCLWIHAVREKGNEGERAVREKGMTSGPPGPGPWEILVLLVVVAPIAFAIYYVWRERRNKR
jgi:hypothetical protein